MMTSARDWMILLIVALLIVTAALFVLPALVPNFWQHAKYIEIGKDETVLKCAVSALSRPSNLPISDIHDNRWAVYFRLKIPEYPKEIYGGVEPSAAAPIQIYLGGPGTEPATRVTRPINEVLTLITANIITECKGREIAKAQWDATR